jgi:hypothetical protein
MLKREVTYAVKMAHKHKVPRRNYENLFRLLVDGGRVRSYSTDCMGGVVNVDVVERSHLSVHQCNEDVHDVEG